LHLLVHVFMVFAEVKWHLLRVQSVISPFLLDKLKLNDKVGPVAAYIAFKPRIAVQLHPLSAISVISFIKEFGAKQNIISLRVLLWNISYDVYIRPESAMLKNGFVEPPSELTRTISTRIAGGIGRGKDTSLS
jgi:hypothetical protein